MARVDDNFFDLVEHYEGSVAARGVGYWNRLSVPFAAARGDASLQKFANHLEASPLRVAGIVTRIEDYDPLALAAVAGKRSMQDLAGVTPEAGRSDSRPTMLEVLARDAAERHFERCRVDPEGAKRAEARWSSERMRLRTGHLANAVDAVDATYGAACSAEREAVLGRRVTVAPPLGYRPQGNHRLTGVGSDRWRQLTDEAVVRTELPKDWRYQARSASHDRARLGYMPRGVGRARQLAARKFSPRVTVARFWLRRRLARAMRRGPVATRQFLAGVAASPSLSAAAIRSRLDPMLVAAAIGPKAVDNQLAGNRVRYPGNIGRLHAALDQTDTDTLALVRRGPDGRLPQGVRDNDYNRAVVGGFGTNTKMRDLAASVVNRVWMRDSRGSAQGDVYDVWRERRACVASGMPNKVIEGRFSDRMETLAAARTSAPVGDERGSLRDSDRGRRPGAGEFSDVAAQTPAVVPAPAAMQPGQPMPSEIPTEPSQPVVPSGAGVPVAPGSVPLEEVPASPGGGPSVPLDDAGSPGAPDPGGQADAPPGPADDGSPASKERDDEKSTPFAGGFDPRRAVIHVPPEALTDVEVKASELPKVTKLEDGTWKVHDDPYVDRVIERPDGSYDVVLHEGVSATLSVQQAAEDAASGAHKRRTDPELVRVQNLNAEQAAADLQRGSVDSLATSVEAGTSCFERPRANFNATLAFDPATGHVYHGLDGQVLRTRAAELGEPDDGRFATRSEIEAAGGVLKEDAEGVVVLRDQFASGQPFGAHGKLDMEAEPVTFGVRTPVVLYHVEAQTDPSPDLPVSEPVRGPKVADLAPIDLVNSTGVDVDTRGAPGGQTGYRPQAILADAEGKPSAVKHEAVVIGQGEHPMQQRSRLMVAAVDAAFTASDADRPRPDRPAPDVYTTVSGKDEAEAARRARHVEESFVKACAVDRVASRIGAGYSPDNTLGEGERKAFAEILRDPVRSDRLSREADRISDWVVDGAKERLQDRGVPTAHERYLDGQGSGRDGSSQPKAREERDEAPVR